MNLSQLSGYAMLFALAVALTIYGVHGVKALVHHHHRPIVASAPLN